MRKALILIDLDGVLNEYNGNFKIDHIPKPRKDTEKFLQEINKNFEITIFTTRNVYLTTKWLIENSLDKYVSDVTNIKKPCFLYIDDRAICHKGNYEKTLEKIKNFNVYWKDYKN